MHGDEVREGTLATLICERRRRVGGDTRPATVVAVRRDNEQRICELTVRDEVSGMLLVFVPDDELHSRRSPVRVERVTTIAPQRRTIETVLPPDADHFESGDYLRSQWPQGRTPDVLRREIRISVGDRAPRFPDSHPAPRGSAPTDQELTLATFPVNLRAT